MVTKTTFKKKFPDVKVQKLQTSVVFSRQQVEDRVKYDLLKGSNPQHEKIESVTVEDN